MIADKANVKTAILKNFFCGKNQKHCQFFSLFLWDKKEDLNKNTKVKYVNTKAL